MGKNTVFGRFLLGRVVARSRSGVLYEALQRDLANRRVAIKALIDSTSDAAEQFHSEVLAMSKLVHPNIVAIYDTGTENGTPYYVSAFIDGLTLKEVLAKEGRLDIARVIHITKQIGRALRYAHSKGVYHADLCPVRVLLTGQQEHVILTGFKSNVPEGVVVGSPGYMSPEQIEGKAVDYTTDIYSLAAIVYEMLTGRNPFFAEGMLAGEVVERQLAGQFRSISEHGGQFKESLDRVFRKAFARKPERYIDISDFLNELQMSLLPAAAELFEKTVGLRHPQPADLSRVIFTHYLSFNFSPVTAGDKVQITEKRIEMGLPIISVKSPQGNDVHDFNVYWLFRQASSNYLIVSESGRKMDDWRMQTRIVLRVVDADTLQVLTPEEVKHLREACIEACNRFWTSKDELEAIFGPFLEKSEEIPQVLESGFIVGGELYFDGQVLPDLWVQVSDYSAETNTVNLVHPITSASMECSILRLFIGDDGQYCVLAVPESTTAVVVKVLDRTVVRTLALSEMNTALNCLLRDQQKRPMWPAEEARLVFLPVAGEKEQDFPPKIKVIKCFACGGLLRHTDSLCPLCGVERLAPPCPMCGKPVVEWAQKQRLSVMDIYVWNSNWDGKCCYCGQEFKALIKAVSTRIPVLGDKDLHDFVEVAPAELVARRLPDYIELSPAIEFKISRTGASGGNSEQSFLLSIEELKELIKQLQGPLALLLKMQSWTKGTT